MPTFASPVADEIAEIGRQDWQRYLETYRPLEQKAIDSLDDSTVEVSMDSAVTDAVRSREALERMRGRYGTSVSADQAAGEARRNSLSGALGVMTAGNNAILADRDNRNQTLASLVNYGQGMNELAMNTYNSAASMESARNAQNYANYAAYEQAKAQRRSSLLSGALSLGTTAAMIYAA